MKKVLMTLTLCFAGAAFAQTPTTDHRSAATQAALDADTTSITAACSAEISKGSCSGEKVGAGLMKCIWKGNKGSLSDGCKSAMKSAKQGLKQLKGSQ